MAENSAQFTLIFKTIADATGITALGQNIESLKGKLEGVGHTINSAFQLLGIGLALRQLNEYGNKALEVNQQQAAFALQVKRSAEGSDELVERLKALNEELERTTGTHTGTTRAIQLQLVTTRATGDQIEGLTRGIIEFSAATGKPVEFLASMIANRLRGAIDETDFSLARLGIHAKDTDGIIRDLNTVGGHTAEAMSRASGGMTEFRTATDNLRTSLGNFVNLVRVPFLTSFSEGLQGTKARIDGVTESFSQVGATVFVSMAVIGDSIGGLFSRGSLVLQNLYHQSQAIGGAIGQFILGVVTSVTSGASALVQGAITQIDRLALHAADLLRELTHGVIDIKVDTSADEGAKAKVQELADWIKNKLGAASGAIGDKTKAAMEAVEKTTAEMQARGETGISKVGEYLDRYQEWVDRIKNVATGATPGSGVIAPGASDAGGGGTKAAAADTDLVTQAKQRLSSAEGFYQAEIERTHLLERAGTITASEGVAMRAEATSAYVAQLVAMQPVLESTIEKLRALGRGDDADQLLLDLERTKNKILEIKQAASDETFFGGMKKSFDDFFASIAPTGARIGQQLTQTIGTAISGISQGLTGAIFKTQTWGQTFLQMGQAIVGQLIQMGVETGVYYLKLFFFQNAQKVQASAHRAADVTEHVAAETTKAGASGISALLTSISSYGWAAIVGLAAVIAAIAYFGTQGFAGGGVVKNGSHGTADDVPIWVSRGEGILTAATVERHGGPTFVDALNSGAFFSRPHYATGGVVGDSGGSSGSSGSGGSGRTTIKQALFFDRREAVRWLMEDPEGQNELFDLLNANRHRLPQT